MKRLYHAVCSLIESKADHLTARAEHTRKPDEPSPGPRPAGSTSQNQVSGKYEPNDMRAGFHRTGIGFTGQLPPPSPVKPLERRKKGFAEL